MIYCNKFPGIWEETFAKLNRVDKRHIGAGFPVLIRISFFFQQEIFVAGVFCFRVLFGRREWPGRDPIDNIRKEEHAETEDDQ